MESQQNILLLKDLCAISEHLRKLKDTIKLCDIKRMLKRAITFHIQKDTIQHYLDDFFKEEAEKSISKKVFDCA